MSREAWLTRAGLASLAAFALLAAAVVTLGPGPILGEERLLNAFEASRGPARTDAALAVTALGGWAGQLPLMGVAVLLLALTGRARAGGALAVLCGAGYLAMTAAKLAFGRPRPDVTHAVYAATGLSFPSGHATASTFFFLGLALVAWRYGARWPLAALVPLAMLVGLTRPFLGVHYPSDVLGGWLFAGGLTLVVAGRLPAAPPEG